MLQTSDKFSLPKIGEPFKPYKLLQVALVPLGMLGYAGTAGKPPAKLSGGARLLFGLLNYHGGTSGEFPFQETLAQEMAVSPETIKRYIRELKAHGFIEVTQNGRGKPNSFELLWHDSLAACLRKKGAELPPFEDQARPGKGGSFEAKGGQNSAKKGSKLTRHYKEEEVLRGIEEVSSSEAVTIVEEPTAAETTDDDGRFSQKTETPNPEDPGAATVPPAGNPQDRDALIEIARQQLQMTRAAGLDFASVTGVISQETLARVRRPDRAITEEILGAFRDYADFTTWLGSTVSRGVARKAKDTRWGLYLSDAKNHAEDAALQREAAEKGRIDGVIERERQRAEARAAVAELDQPRPWLQAFGKIQYRVQSAGRDIPPSLKARLKRTGELISPHDLAQQIFTWQRCAQCADSGTIGDAIDKTLDFCACPAGEEAAYGKGAGWPAQEIARVHADAKSLLVAACHAVGCPFTADAVADCVVADCDGSLEIRLTDRHFGIDQGDVRKAVERLQWDRRIVIVSARQQRPKLAPAAKPEAAAPARPPITQADIDVELAKRRQKMCEYGHMPA